MESIDKMTDIWFLTEPALFGAFCAHKLTENRQLDCPVRVGQGRIEYNPYIVAGMPYSSVEELFRVEMIRVLLLHPYSRKPEGCSTDAILLGSDMAIATNYPITRLVSPAQMGLPEGECYEWYAHMMQFQMVQQPSFGIEDGSGGGASEDSREGTTGSDATGLWQEDAWMADMMQFQMVQQPSFGIGDGSGGGASEDSREGTTGSDATGLWQEDAWMAEEVKNLAENTTSWGSLPGNLVDRILAGLKPKLDYRKVLSGFRSSVLCSKRKLTRMRPNRRSGFQYMGSIRQLRTNYLVAVDVSGSISGEDLKYFFSTINRFFKYGVEKIDALTFDTELGETVSLSKAQKEFNVKGRGGTDFQPIVNYMAEHPEYDGLIIFTDGYASKPEVPVKLKGRILWILRSEKEYNDHRSWMRESGRVCFIENR